MRTRSASAVSIVLMLSCLATQGFAQQGGGKKSLMLMTWFGPGEIPLPTGPEWKQELLTVYDQGRRPVAQYEKQGTGLTASFILFENLSGKPTAFGCREDAISPIVAHAGKSIANRSDNEIKNSYGDTLATTFYFIEMSPSSSARQLNLFGFAGDAKTCAEIHVSTVVPSEETAMKRLVEDFHPNLTYQPNSQDYFVLASILFDKAPRLAAPYYKASLDTMPADSSHSITRRVATDQLVMSLGMSGDLQSARGVAEQAIASDPEYPINYYNLACIDAEAGDAPGAKANLKLAFQRRENVLKGESMPDPTKDDSILKLKDNKDFWAFVLALPKN